MTRRWSSDDQRVVVDGLKQAIKGEAARNDKKAVTSTDNSASSSSEDSEVSDADSQNESQKWARKDSLLKTRKAKIFAVTALNRTGVASADAGMTGVLGGSHRGGQDSAADPGSPRSGRHASA